MPDHILLLPSSQGMSVYRYGYGFGTIIAMKSDNGTWANGVEWNSPAIEDQFIENQYLGIEGVSPNHLIIL